MGLASSTQRADLAKKAIKELKAVSVADEFGDCAYSQLFGSSCSATSAGTDADFIKNVQYLGSISNDEATKNFDKAVLAGILEVATDGAKPHTLAHLQKKGASAAQEVLPRGSIAAFEKQLDRLHKVILVALTEHLSRDTTVPDHEFRPELLEKGTLVQRGKDWSAGDEEGTNEIGTVERMVTFSGQTKRGVAVRWPGRTSVGRYRWNLNPLHAQDGDNFTTAPADGVAYYDVAVVRTVKGKSSWSWPQGLSAWRATHAAAAGPATNSFDMTAAELDTFIQGPIASPYLNGAAAHTVLTSLSKAVKQAPDSDAAAPVRRAQADLLRLILRFVLPVLYHHVEVCTGASAPGPAPTEAEASPVALALAEEGAPLAASQQVAQALQFLSELVASAAICVKAPSEAGDPLVEAVLESAEQCTLALGLMASMDRPRKSKTKGKKTSAVSASEATSSGAGAASGGGAAAPGPSEATTAQRAVGDVKTHKGVFPDIIARMACTEIGPGVVDLLAVVSQRIKALPAEAQAAAAARQCESDAHWCSWTVDGKDAEPQGDAAGMYSAASGGAEDLSEEVTRWLQLHRCLSVAASRAAGTLLLSTPPSAGESAAAGWLASSVFSGGIGSPATKGLAAVLLGPQGGGGLLVNDSHANVTGIAACSQKTLTNSGVDAVVSANTESLSKTLRAFMSDKSSKAELLKLGFLDDQLQADGLELPAPAIALAHWLDAHLRRGSQAILKNKTKSAITAGVPLGNAFGTVYTAAECSAMAALLHHSGSVDNARALVKQWYSQFVRVTQQGASGKERPLLVEIAECTDAPSDTFVAVHKRFSEVRDSLRDLKTAEAAGDLRAALKHTPRTSLAEPAAAKAATGGSADPTESKEEESGVSASESKAEQPAAASAAAGAAAATRHSSASSAKLLGVNNCGADGATSATLPAHVRQLDAPTDTNMAVQQLALRAQLLLCLAPATRSAHGAVRHGGAAGWLPAGTGASLGADLGHIEQESPSLAAVDAALHAASAYLTHGHAAPPRALLPWLLSRTLRARQKKLALHMVQSALCAALGVTSPGLEAAAYSLESRSSLQLFLASAREVLRPLPFVLAARSSSKLPNGSHFAQDASGISQHDASELHAAWASVLLGCGRVLALSRQLADSATFAIAAQLWLRELHASDFELLVKSGVMDELLSASKDPSAAWCDAAPGLSGMEVTPIKQNEQAASYTDDIGAQQADLLEAVPAAAGGGGDEERERPWELMDPTVVGAALATDSMSTTNVARLIRLFASTPAGRRIGLNRVNRLLVTALGRMPAPTEPTIPEGADTEAVAALLEQHARAQEAHERDRLAAIEQLGGDVSSVGVDVEHPLVKWWIDNNAFDGVGAILAANPGADALAAAYGAFAEQVRAVQGSNPELSQSPEDELAAAIAASLAMEQPSSAAASSTTAAATAADDAAAAPALAAASSTAATDAAPVDDKPEPAKTASVRVYWAVPRIAQAALGMILASALGARRSGAAGAFIIQQLGAEEVPPAAPLAAAQLVRSTSRASPLALAENAGAGRAHGPAAMGALDSGAIVSRGLPAHCATALGLHSDAACRAVAAHLFAGEGVAGVSAKAFLPHMKHAQKLSLQRLTQALTGPAMLLHEHAFGGKVGEAQAHEAQERAVWGAQLLFSLRDMAAVRAWMASEEGLRCAWQLVRAGGLQLQQVAFLWLRWVVRDTPPVMVDAALWSILCTDGSLASPLGTEGYVPGTLVSVFLLAIAGCSTALLGDDSSSAAMPSDASMAKPTVLVGTFPLPPAEFGPLLPASLLLAAGECEQQCGGVRSAVGAFAGHSLQVLASAATHLLRLLASSTRVHDDSGAAVPPPPSVNAFPRQPSLGLKHSSSLGGANAAFREIAPVGSWASAALSSVRGALGCDVVQPLVEQLQHSAHTGSAPPAAASALGLSLGALLTLNGNTEVVAVGARVASPGMQAQAATAGATSTKALAERYSAFVVGYARGSGVAEVMFPPTSGQWHPGNPVQRMVAPVLRALEADPLPSAACVNVLLGGDEAGCDGSPSLTSTAWFDDSVLESLRLLLLLASMAKVQTPAQVPEETLSKANAEAGGGAADAAQAIRGLASGAGAQRKSASGSVIPGETTTLGHEQAVVAGAAEPGVSASASGAAAMGVSSDSVSAADTGVSALSVLGVEGAEGTSFELASVPAAAVLASLQTAAARCLQVAIADDLKGLPLAMALFALASKAQAGTKSADVRSLSIVRLLAALGVSAQPLVSMVAPRHVREASTVILSKLLEHTALGARAGSLLPLSEASSGPAEDPPEVVARKAKAAELANMGFDYELVLKGLEMKADDPERVLDWILSGEAEAFKAGDGLKGGPADGEENPRYAAAQTLAVTAAKPTKLCVRALELKADNPNAALNWLLDEGAAYLPGLSVGDSEDFGGAGGMAGVMKQHLHGELADSAVLDDIGVTAGAAENLIPDEEGFTQAFTQPGEMSDSDTGSEGSWSSEYSSDGAFSPDRMPRSIAQARHMLSDSDSDETSTTHGSDTPTEDDADDDFLDAWIQWAAEQPEASAQRRSVLNLLALGDLCPEHAQACFSTATRLASHFIGMYLNGTGDDHIPDMMRQFLVQASSEAVDSAMDGRGTERLTALLPQLRLLLSLDLDEEMEDEMMALQDPHAMRATMRMVCEHTRDDENVPEAERATCEMYLTASLPANRGSGVANESASSPQPPQRRLSRGGGSPQMISFAVHSGSGAVQDEPREERRQTTLAADAAVVSDAAATVVHVARQPMSSEHEAVFLPLPGAGTSGVSAGDWRGCVVSFPYVKRQRLTMVAGQAEEDYDDGSNTLKRQWRVTVLTGVLLDDCGSAQDDTLRVAVLNEASGFLHVRRIHRQRLFVHASVMGALPLSKARADACSPLVAQAVATQHACMRNAARGALLNLLLLSTGVFSQSSAASSPLLDEDAPAPSLGPGPLRGVVSRAELMRLVKLSAATEDTFGVHVQGEAAVAAGASVGAEPGQYLSAGRGGSQVLPIGSPSVGAWLLLLQTWLDAEMDGEQAGASTQLTTSLTAEAARHIDLATNPGSAASSGANGSNFLMRESLHPHYHSCETRDTLTFPGARALWLFFDSRSETHQNARLNFFAGMPSQTGGASIHSVGGAPSNFRPFVIHGDTVHMSFHASHSSSESCWGYRVYVAPMLGLAWTNEAEVATGAASLEWACYALEFLLGSFDASDASSRHSAVHSAGVFNALVSYLRARGTPFKSRVVSLLTQLLKTPEAYPVHDLPNMALLHGVEKAVFKYVEGELARASGRAFPSGLLQLIELLITARMAQRSMDSAQSTAALQSGVAISNIGVQESAPPGLAAVFLPRSMRAAIAEAAAAASAGGGVATGAGGPALQLATPVRSAVRDISAFDAKAEAASATESELGSRALSDILLETMDIIEAIHARQLALAAIGDGASNAADAVLPLPPALLLRCVLSAGWAADSAAVTPDMLLSAAASLGLWTFAADEQLVQWLTTITSPARRSLVADAKARLEREKEGSAAEFDWDPCCSGAARSPLGLSAAKLQLLAAPAEGQHAVGASGKPVHASIPDDAIAFPALAAAGVSMPALRLRVALLQLLNRRLKRVLPLIDVVRAGKSGDESDPAGSGGAGGGKSASAGANLSFSLGHKLRALAHCVFIDVKRQVLEGCIEATWTGGNGSGFSVTLDNKAAFKHMESAAHDTALRSPDKAHCIAAQLFKALTKQAAGATAKGVGEADGAAVGAAMARGLRSKNDHKESLWKVAYRGEDGMDWGGLYRDCFSRVVDDLFSESMDVFLPTPNNVTAAGLFQDKWLPNPSNTTPSALAFYTFVGRLIGVTLRHNMQLPFDLAPAVWARVLNAGDADKAATGSKRRRGAKRDPGSGVWELHDDAHSQRLRDLEKMTYAQFVAAHAADEVSLGAADAAAAEDVQPLFFTTAGSDGTQVELCPGGDDRRVLTKSDLKEFIALSRQQREHEFDAQCAAMRGGLVSIIPPRALQLLTWREMELLVCGDPVVDVELLKKHTQYDSYEADDEGVARFWRCFETLSNEERGKFIRFSWGRSRLPEPGQFSRKFRLSKRGGNDGSLPVAHACFWQVEWPEYSTDDIALQRMRIAINYGMSGEFLIA